MLLYYAKKFAVVGNTIDTNGTSGIACKTGSSTGLIAGNTIEHSVADTGIYIKKGSLDLTIKENTIDDCASDGVYLAGTNAIHVDLTGNTIDGNSSKGVYVTGGTVTLEANTISGNTGIGLNLLSTLGATVGGSTAAAGNLIESNGIDGIDLFGSLVTPSTNDVIENNTIGGALEAEGNAHYGIWAKWTSGLWIQSNTIEENQKDGIYIDQSAAATIGGTSNGSANVISKNNFGSLDAYSVNDFAYIGNTLDSNGYSGISCESAGDRNRSPIISLTTAEPKWDFTFLAASYPSPCWWRIIPSRMAVAEAFRSLAARRSKCSSRETRSPATPSKAST